MNSIGFVIVLGLFAITSASAREREVGNGGPGLVCRDSKGEPRSARTLDLWEAQTIYGLTLDSPRANADEELTAAISRLKDRIEILGNLAEAARNRVTGTFRNEPRDKSDARPADLGLEPDLWFDRLGSIPCSSGVSPATVEFLAERVSARAVVINSALFPLLAQSPQEEAALKLHEILYVTLDRHRSRDSRVNSLFARRAVAIAFAAPHVLKCEGLVGCFDELSRRASAYPTLKRVRLPYLMKPLRKPASLKKH